MLNSTESPIYLDFTLPPSRAAQFLNSGKGEWRLWQVFSYLTKCSLGVHVACDGHMVYTRNLILQFKRISWLPHMYMVIRNSKGLMKLHWNFQEGAEIELTHLPWGNVYIFWSKQQNVLYRSNWLPSRKECIALVSPINYRTIAQSSKICLRQYNK